MPARKGPLIDLLEQSPLAGRLVDQARKTVRAHVLNEVVGGPIETRVDQILGRVRRR